MQQPAVITKNSAINVEFSSTEEEIYIFLRNTCLCFQCAIKLVFLVTVQICPTRNNGIGMFFQHHYFSLKLWLKLSVDKQNDFMKYFEKFQGLVISNVHFFLYAVMTLVIITPCFFSQITVIGGATQNERYFHLLLNYF